MLVDDMVRPAAGAPVLRVVRGRVTEEELAALTVVLTLARRPAAAAADGCGRPAAVVARRARWAGTNYRAPSAWAAA
ncbi:acyl-CoA carboxylase subunit epsilon [Kitasatospora sp. NPDC008050]|uniref:acyl-CoA carboxylase subunit epsilon n=1 Tax=Kitasatospora sp. NPDC008050 TaxID=3364021 RepID=UPI0036E9030B